MGDFQLSEEQLRRVMERAIELDTTAGGARRSWDLQAIEALGAEIGVSSSAIKAAWIEASTIGAPLPFQEHLVDRQPLDFARRVAGDEASVLSSVQRWFHDAGFEPIRHTASSVLLERTGRLRVARLAGIRQVVVDVRGLPDDAPATFVRITLGRKRPGRQHFVHEAVEAARGWVIADGIVVLVSEAVTIEHGLLALPAVLALGTGQGWWRSRSKQRQQLNDVRVAVEGLLDVIELQGPEAIEPAGDD